MHIGRENFGLRLGMEKALYMFHVSRRVRELRTARFRQGLS